MKPLYRIILFVLLCWFGYNAIRKTFQPYVPAVDNLFRIVSLIVLLLLLLLALFSDEKKYRSDRRLFQFYTSFAGLLIVSVYVSRLLLFRNIEQNETAIYLIKKTGRGNMDGIELKKNGFFKLAEKDLHSVPHYYYGKWYQNRDSLIITQTNHEYLNQKLPLIGIVRSGTVIWSTGDTMLIGAKAK